MDIVFWTLDSNDWKIKKADKIANQIIDNIHNNYIILMHDSYQRSLEALKIVIPILKKQGYYITTISEMKDMNFLKQNYEI